MFDTHFSQLKARVIPILVRPDGSYRNDSTPIILELEEAFPNPTRSLIPRAPSLAFLAALLEDFGDEWMTKVMFEGRFHTAKDAAFGAAWQFWQAGAAARQGVPPARIDATVKAFASRQVKRRARIVGSDWTVMERTLREVCQILTDLWRNGEGPFLFGRRPTNADFGLFGQLRQLAADPLPSTVMHEYPLAWSWVWMVDELGGLEPPLDDTLAYGKATPAVIRLLKLASTTHLPFLKANHAAFVGGAKELRVPIFGGDHIHAQPPFRYQANYCWPQLQQQFSQLKGKERAKAVAVLRKTGCLPFFDGSSGSSGTSSRL